MVVHLVNSGLQSGSNIYLVVGSRTALIDAGLDRDSARNIAAIKKLLNGRGLDMIILTHFHFDHIGGLNDMLDEFGSEAYAGAGDAPYIANCDSAYTLSEMFGGTLEPTEITELMEGDVIDLGEHRLRVVNTPGHTCGGICLYDEVTSSLFSGDTVFSCGIGRTDFPTGSAKELAASLRKLSGIDVGMLYPGHSETDSDGNRAIRYGLMMIGGGF
ncbi:MAG: MBL fold metallo-hydrolase [Candidatus Methanoplasma sp.]|jgi:glyoxylase-like metal-dependent hydrolase (beta-lactamase superfamily II)|nr:MBL fold metallo-hydrolase [Candidatus Methanoplasma sp.]